MIFLVSLQVHHRQGNCWCIIDLLGLDGFGAFHQEVSQAWNICCDVYKYTENIHEVFHDLRLVPCCFCAGFLHLAEKAAGEKNRFIVLCFVLDIIDTKKNGFL